MGSLGALPRAQWRMPPLHTLPPSRLTRLKQAAALNSTGDGRPNRRRWFARTRAAKLSGSNTREHVPTHPGRQVFRQRRSVRRVFSRGTQANPEFRCHRSHHTKGAQRCAALRQPAYGECFRPRTPPHSARRAAGRVARPKPAGSGRAPGSPAVRRRHHATADGVRASCANQRLRSGRSNTRARQDSPVSRLVNSNAAYGPPRSSAKPKTSGEAPWRMRAGAVSKPLRRP